MAVTDASDTSTAPLTPGEFGLALQGLSQASVLRLRAVARIYAAGTGFDPDDLLQLTLERTIAGRRTCPRDVPIVTFLVNAMRSIAWADRQKRKVEPKKSGLVRLDNPKHHDEIADPAPSAEAQLVERSIKEERLKAITDLFDDDEQALLVVMGDLDGLSAQQIRELGNMNEKAYATVRRRIRRRIVKAANKAV